MNKRIFPRAQPKLLLAILLAGVCVAPAQAAETEGQDRQRIADDARQAAMERLEAAQEQANDAQVEATLDRQALAEVQAEAKAEAARMKAFKQYDQARIEKLTQIAALNSLPLLAVSPESHKHRNEDADSSEDSGGRNDSVNERHPLNGDGKIYVNNVSGTVVVNAWDKNEVQINGSLGYGVDHLEVTGDAASLSVVVKLPKHSHNSGESDLRLIVPAGATVELETVSADASVRGTRGPVKISTVSGDVGIDVQSQEVAVQTVSGDMILRAPSKVTQANTVSGDVHLSGLQGKLSVETVSGNLSVKGSRFSELKLKSVSGDMGLDASFLPEAMVTSETLSGNITLHVPTDVSGTAMIKSFSGEAQCDLPQSASASAASSSRNSSSKKREFVFGDGKIYVNNVSGT
ncbi:MAG: DUF4097 family beta strand repeat-containing protein, partial [Nevskiales bacterium]